MKRVKPRQEIFHQEEMTGDKNGKAGTFRVVRKQKETADWKCSIIGTILKGSQLRYRRGYNQRNKDK